MVINQKTNTNKRSVLLWLLLSLTLLLTIVTAYNDSTDNNHDDMIELTHGLNDEKAKPYSINNALNVTVAVANDEVLFGQNLTRHPMTTPIKNLFASPNWYINKTKAETKRVTEPVQAPQAPAVPFKYIGKLENTPAGTVIFLEGFGNAYTVKVGEKVNESWRLESEDNHKLMFTYLPLDLSTELIKNQPILPVQYPSKSSGVGL